jgi:hypothetical protein
MKSSSHNLIIPLSVTYIGSKVFAVNHGQDGKKDLTIIYAGTFAQWEDITEDDWASGLKGTTLICSDGTYIQRNNGSWQ